MAKNSSGTFVAFLSGLAVGAAIGILYAPDKGKNTRDKLSFQLSKLKERLQKTIDDLTSGKSQPVSAAKSEGQKVVSDAIKHAERLKSEVDDLMNQISPTRPRK